MYFMDCVGFGNSKLFSVLGPQDGDDANSSENEATVGAGEDSFVWQFESLQLQSLNVDEALS